MKTIKRCLGFLFDLVEAAAVPAFILGLTLLLAPGAFAGSTRFDIQTSALQTATGNGGGISVSGIKELVVIVDVTASVGPPTIDIYLQSSSDGGTTWSDLLFDWSCESPVTASATEGTVQTNKRSIADGLNTAAPKRYTAKYSVFGDYIRAAWVVSGATSYTFSVKAIGKN